GMGSSPAAASAAPPARHGRSARYDVLAGLFGGLLIAGQIAGSALMIWKSRVEAIAEWRGILSNVSTILAEHALQSVKAADLVLKSITDRVHE
ncbi:hypothetical protein V3478_32840, partial [Pseudomonas aeruginosa]|uniref:hypothetical protein n=1 Tax=Pseudomonas aeruginosa TaxID=287 RepID=UPI002F9276F2